RCGNLGSARNASPARTSRAGFGGSPKQSFLKIKFALARPPVLPQARDEPRALPRKEVPPPPRHVSLSPRQSCCARLLLSPERAISLLSTKRIHPHLVHSKSRTTRLRNLRMALLAQIFVTRSRSGLLRSERASCRERV